MRHSDETIRRIGDLYRNGWGHREIGRITGVPEETVRKVLRGHCPRYRRLLGGRLMNGQRPKQTLQIYA